MYKDCDAFRLPVKKFQKLHCRNEAGAFGLLTNTNLSYSDIQVHDHVKFFSNTLITERLRLSTEITYTY